MEGSDTTTLRVPLLFEEAGCGDQHDRYRHQAHDRPRDRRPGHSETQVQDGGGDDAYGKRPHRPPGPRPCLPECEKEDSTHEHTKLNQVYAVGTDAEIAEPGTCVALGRDLSERRAGRIHRLVGDATGQVDQTQDHAGPSNCKQTPPCVPLQPPHLKPPPKAGLCANLVPVT